MSSSTSAASYPRFGCGGLVVDNLVGCRDVDCTLWRILWVSTVQSFPLTDGRCRHYKMDGWMEDTVCLCNRQSLYFRSCLTMKATSIDPSSRREPTNDQVSERDTPSLHPRNTLTLTSTPARTMGYQQWVVIKINNSSAKTVVVKNVNLTWGKFYPDSKSPVSSA